MRILLLALLAFAAIAAGSATATTSLPAFSAELDARWDYGNPALSEQRFRTELAKWQARDAQALSWRRRSRAPRGCAASLRRRMQRSMPSPAELEGAPSHVRVRYLLERGRVFNSAGARERALPLFAEALSLAECAGDEFYAIDAAHMLGIAAPAAEQLDWNLKALALARAATDPRARRWDASLYNNIGWTYHDWGDAAGALGDRERALAAREAAGDARRIREARWTVARGLRSVGRLDEAQAIQLALATELGRAGETDGYVYEELAEIALARGDAGAARPWAAKARAALEADADLVAREPERLARLGAIAEGKVPRDERHEATRDLRAAARRQSATEIGDRKSHAVRASRRGRTVRAGDRQGRQQGDRGALSGRQHAEGDCEARRRRADPVHPVDRPLPQQGEEHRRPGRDPAAEHGGKVPADREALQKLPGVGRKTANVVLNVAFGEPTIAVDTHIFRVANRTGIAPAATPELVEQKLLKVVPDEFKLHAHHWLILHGRYVCIARAPKCGECIIRDLCEYRHKNL